MKKKYLAVALVGNEDRPAGPKDIKDVRKNLKSVLSKKDYSLVTHHAVDIRMYPFDAVKDSLIVIKVGSNGRPASEKDITDTYTQFKKALAGDGLFVSHHAVDIQLFPHSSRANSLMIVKAGSDDFPASAKDIIDIQTAAAKATSTDNIWVTHHLVDVGLYPR